MRPELASHFARQHGLVTRAQAVAAGCTERELRTLTGVHGPWTVVRRGVYVATDSWLAASDSGRAVWRDRAAHLTMSRAHVMSHDSAARALGLPLLASGDLVHVTRPGVMGSRTEHGVKHHLTRRWEPGTVQAGLPVTGVARTAVDLAREHGLEQGVVACDAALRTGVRRADLAAELARMWCWPNITRAHAALECSDAGAESPGESLARLLVTELGFGRPETQFPLLVDGRVLRCDLRLGCHVFEFDGRIKYVAERDGGVATEPVEQVVWREKRRERLIRGEGLGMSRILWEDFWGTARTRAVARLRQEYLVTARTLGAALPPHLRGFADAHRDRRTAS